MSNERKISWTSTKFKSLVLQWMSSRKCKDNPQNKEKTFANYISKGLESIIYKDFLQRQITLCKKWTKKKNRHFSRKDVHITKKYMKSGRTLSVMKEMQIKITVRYHFTPTRRYSQKVNQVLVKMWGNWNLHTLLVGT